MTADPAVWPPPLDTPVDIRAICCGHVLGERRVWWAAEPVELSIRACPNGNPMAHDPHTTITYTLWSET